MRIASKVLVLGGLLLFLPVASAWAQAPIVSPIGNVTLNAGAGTLVNVVAVDPNGDAITLSVSGAAFATLNAPTTGTGLVVTTLALSPLAADVGPHTITVTATANAETDTEDLLVQVNAAGSDQAPLVVAPPTKTVDEGQLLTFPVTASDADAEAIASLTASGLPTGATFTTDTAYLVGTFSWTPSLTQAGSYDVGFIAANALQGSAVTHIQVNNVAENHPPVVTAPATLSVGAGLALSFHPAATDEDGDHVTLTATGVPSGATFTDNGNNAATFLWATSTTAAGTYTITVTGDDGHGGTDTAVTIITVFETGGGNVAPVLTVPATRTVDEGVMLTFNVSATDADGDTTNLTASGLPTGATFMDHDNNTGTFTWTPASDQSGTYKVMFVANDAHGGTDTDSTNITVVDVTGGGAAEATAKLLGKIHRHRKFICFQIRPVDNSFNPADADLSTITLNFNGASVDAMSHKTHVSFDCEGNDDDDHDGDCHECGDRDDDHDTGKWGDHRGENQGQGGNRRKWVDRERQGTTGQGDGDKRQWADGSNNQWDDTAEGQNDNGDGHDCDGDGHDDGDDADSTNCVASNIHACFSVHDLRELFGDESIADNLDEITITGDLTTGGTFEATITGHHANNGNGHGKDKDKKHHGHGAMNVWATPNPFNPQTILTFTLTQPARVRVNIFDLRGALVKTLLNENRNAGTQTVPWDGTDSKQQRVVSGIYFVQVQSNQDRVVQRLTVLK